jgi:hypothetical protein
MDGYGQLVSAHEARMFDDSMLPKETQEPESKILLKTGNALWSYRNQNRIYNIPVAEQDRDLPIERDEELLAMFELHREACSEMFWMSPDDEESVKRYDNILKRLSDGEIEIIHEDKQYDAAHSRFLVWIRYDKLWFQLHPRFNKQLHEENHE